MKSQGRSQPSPRLRGLAASVVVAVLCSSGVWWTAAAENEPAAQNKPKGTVRVFMRGKLDSSQKILEGLVVEDFNQIRKGAEHLISMSKATEWVVIQGPVFAQYSAEFRRSAEKLVKVTKDENIDSAALTYLHLTMSCVECHKFVRSTQLAQGRPVTVPADTLLTGSPAALRAAAGR